MKFVMPYPALPSTLRELSRAPRRLEAQARAFAGGAAVPPPGGGFSLVEQVWHLADLEQDGFGERIARLKEGGRPVLPDFDGERMAQERDYRGREVGEGLAAFRAARTANLRALRSLPARAWQHAGVQDGIGPVRLRDIPRLMLEHDQAHRSEIEQLVAATARATKPGGAGSAPATTATRSAETAGASEPMKWHLLIHQLPPKPLYLRAKIRNRLARVGALALKNSVYVLPCRDDCLEDLQWIAQEAAAGGGDAYVSSGHFLHGVSDDVLVRRFQLQSRASYQAITREIADAQGRLRRRAAPDASETSTTLLRLKKRFDEVAAADFFAAPGRKEAETMLRSFEARRRGRGGEPPRGTRPAMELVGRVWVTRRGVKVDRIASAWLVRRFVDPGARFRFVDPEEPPRAGELRFDMVGGDFTHQGDRCTFESLLARLAIHDPALAPIADIVHDIDLKDGKYGRPDAPGVQQLVLGLVASHPDDAERLERGFALFDDLYASFKATPATARSAPKTSARRKRT